MKVSCPLVGMHFHPPAKQLLAVLPSACQLVLRLEPSNPYDENAIMVFVSGGVIPVSQHAVLQETLPPTGFTLEEVLESEEGSPDKTPCRLWHLGYVKRDYAADLAPRLAKICMEEGSRDFAGELAFAGDGKPLVVVDVPV